MSIFQDAIRKGVASVPQSNGDVVELVSVELCEEKTHLALLFHRANPDAPDPIYRRRTHSGLNLRASDKGDDEEQAYSAHMVIDVKPLRLGVYRMTLEEVPGLSATSVVGVLKNVASAIEYECEDDRRQVLKTYTVINCDGYSSESLEQALTKGRINYIDLWKGPDKDLEQDGAYAPSRQKVSLRVYEPITRHNYRDRFLSIFSLSRDKGFDDVRVRIDFDDDRRSRVVTLNREDAAANILFVRSKHFDFGDDLDLCYVSLHKPLIDVAKVYLSEVT
ncbi:hypothetical protein [Paracoccus aminophilus]|nr:hypothetical protein [Paracoccus aminophilus]